MKRKEKTCSIDMKKVVNKNSLWVSLDIAISKDFIQDLIHLQNFLKKFKELEKHVRMTQLKENLNKEIF
jgi:hypothetical protein